MNLNNLHNITYQSLIRSGCDIKHTNEYNLLSSVCKLLLDDPNSYTNIVSKALLFSEPNETNQPSLLDHFMNYNDHRLTNVFIDRYTHERFDALMLFGKYHHPFCWQTFKVIYKKVATSSTDMPEIYTWISEYVIKSKDIKTIDEWFSTYKPRPDMIYHVNREYKHDILECLSRHMNIGNIRIKTRYRHLFQDTKEDYVSLLALEIMKYKPDINNLRFLLYHINFNKEIVFGDPFPIHVIKQDMNDVLMLLSEYTVDYQVKDSQGHNCLYHACVNGNIEMMNRLYDRGVRVDFDINDLNVDGEVRRWIEKKKVDHLPTVVNQDKDNFVMNALSRNLKSLM